MIKLPTPGPTRDRMREVEWQRQIEAADKLNHKKNQDIQVGDARLLLTADDGTRYELEIANDGYVKIKTIDGVEVPGLNQSQLSETVVVERTPIVTLNSSFGLSNLRDIQETTNSAAISATGGEILLSTGATASSKATLESAQVGSYIAGYGAEIGINLRVPTAPTGNQVAIFGGRTPDGNNGFYWGVDATGIFVARLSGGTETKVYQSNFNIDPLDGTGKSGFTLDQTKGYIHQVKFTWYGAGQILYGIMAIVDDVQRFIPCHSLKVDESISIEDPNLAVIAEADNGGDAADLDLYVAGRQYSIVGKYVPNRRLTGESRGSVSTSTTIEPLVTFKRKTGFLDRSVRIQGFEVDVGTEPVIVEIRLNGSLTGASYGTPSNHTAAETALEVDTSATAISGGEVVYTKYFDAAQVGQETTTGETGSLAIDLEIPRDQPVTLCARTLSGTGTIVSHMRMAEEW